MNIEISEILAEKVLEEIQILLKDKTDVQTWTLDTRDAEFEHVLNQALTVVEPSVVMGQELLSQTVNGQSFLYWNLRTQILGSLLQWLMGARNELDTMTEEETKDVPVDLLWLTSKIRQVIPMYNEALNALQEGIQQFQSGAPTEVEAL